MAEVQIRQRTMLTVSLAGAMGSAIDVYDFFLSASASVAVWPFIFFVRAGPALALTVSIATYALSYFMRPIASILFGHWGDRLGRLNVLVWTLLTMGIGTFGIALTPSYASIGLAAPILIIVFRLLQGLGLGGEVGGAVAWASEFASKSRLRGFFTGLVTSMNSIGFSLGAIAVLITSTSLPRDAFLAWGWRVPFLAGGVVLVLGVVIRYRLLESPVFKAMKEKQAVERYPITRLFRERWKVVLLLIGGLSFLSNGVITGPPYIFILASAYRVVPLVSYAFLLSGVISALIIVAATALVEPLGRKTLLMISAVGGILTVFPSFYFVTLRDFSLIFAGLFVYQCIYRLAYGAIGAIMAESLATRYRFTGSGFIYGTAASLPAIGVLIQPFLIGYAGAANSWIYVGTEAAVFLLISAICIAFLKETKGKPLED